MADNTPQNGTATIATDDLAFRNGGAVSGVQAQVVKVGWGVDGTYNDTIITAGLPVQSQQSATATITAPTVGSADATVLASNAVRKSAVMYNGTNLDVLLAFGSAATTTNYTVRVVAGGYYELPGQNLIYTGVLHGLAVTPGTLTAATVSTGTFVVTELT